ncbi:hemoglobin [Zhouia amylolytica]|uniref:Globin n=2 Tax=Zhouia amylolytica TaxID=376730 RepID=W2ULX8_9FLAO|nr:group 1 truncated hemoglobin [Zhouia amylolytica]ETN95023.1 globin [Zhouia amylolytica AD3]MCQ0110611.1 group 1 truncated hemoglobin [Zhouia amylolytica]SFS63989.1 hemoglobin [Zhouia amylolytica]
MESANKNSLYHRLGELKGIEAIVDDAVDAHMTNPTVKSRFTPLLEDPNHFKQVRQHLIDFFAAGAGGNIDYKGMDMLKAHKGMNISKGEYLAVMDDIMGALEKHNIDEPTKKDVLAIIYSLREQIIGV